ncbi:MAG: hypothetical protein ACOYK8_01265 [Alphaproteobacteria bacterium]
MDNMTAIIMEKVRAGEDKPAAALLQQMVEQSLHLQVVDIRFNRDGYSLNSVNGFCVNSADQQKLFFKFHHEKGEEILKEYYQAQLLEQAGFPVDAPLYASAIPGKQILFYRYTDNKRLADLCMEEEAANSPRAQQMIAAQQQLDQHILRCYQQTLHPITVEDVREQAIMQLFYRRLVDKEGDTEFGGRVKSFYVGQEFILPGLVKPISFEQLAALRWVVNGIPYQQNLGELFSASRELLSPQGFMGQLGVTAHGDAHNANIWFDESVQPPILKQFDPGFAGQHIPALLAEVKPLFHNIFSHPQWLYYPTQAVDWLKAEARIEGDTIHVQHNWQLSPLRAAFLESKRQNIFVPLLRLLAENNALPENWQQYIRLGLFCCPTLVINMRSQQKTGESGWLGHNPLTSLFALSIAAMVGSKPENGQHDVISTFFDNTRKGIGL